MTAVLLFPDDPGQPRALAVLGGPGPAGTGPAPTVVQVVRADTGAVTVDRHLRVEADADAPDPWRVVADVLVTRGGPQQVTELARHHPGALVVAAHDGPDCWLLLGSPRDSRVRACWRRPDPGTAAGTDPPWPVWASLVHSWLVAGIPAETVRTSSALLLGPTGSAETAVREEVGVMQEAWQGHW
ncbi:hypothetical protein [Actinacidiphila acididurans]|uniref:Uncharacterized protein n=1 Tax=Actinacidiphila acididurans TaxID=2784346 RepID=A0ABS2TJZ8_9ACTN|nr:hypothetical protein [Actinacidiphila acididurans]MBM9503670.1 hypothetical protein [Actinacidiphila acididurans]